MFGDDFDFAYSSAYDQNRTEEVSVDAEITGNAEEDEVEVEVINTTSSNFISLPIVYISVNNLPIVVFKFLQVCANYYFTPRIERIADLKWVG